MPRRIHDVFISHAWEDKDAIARPLAEGLRNRGYDVWYDEFTLRVGDSLRQSIDKGLAASRYGVVILSPHFITKGWTKYELDGLNARQVRRQGKLILPVWHNVGAADVARLSPTLADRVAVLSTEGIDVVVDRIANSIPRRRTRTTAAEPSDVPAEASIALVGVGALGRIVRDALPSLSPSRGPAQPPLRLVLADTTAPTHMPSLPMTVACKQCGAPIDESPNLPTYERTACPRCGSTSRLVGMHVQGFLGSSGGAT